MRCCSRRYSIIMNLDRTSQKFAPLSSTVTLLTIRARARPRLLRIHPWAGETANAGFKQAAIVIDQRHRLEWIALIWLARHPIPGFRREQSEPIIEFALVKKSRLVQQKLLAAAKIERWRVRSCGQNPTFGRRLCALPVCASVSTFFAMSGLRRRTNFAAAVGHVA